MRRVDGLIVTSIRVWELLGFGAVYVGVDEDTDTASLWIPSGLINSQCE